MKKILVIGSANADLTIHTSRMPKLGETISGSDFTTAAGGKGLNQAAAVAKLGGKVSFLGAVGCDAQGALLKNTLQEYGIAFAGIESADTATGIALVTVAGGDNFIILSPGANELVTPALIEAKKELIAEADCLVMQLEIPLESVIRAAEIAAAYGTMVFLNPAPARELPDALLGMTDVLVPNEHEAASLTGISAETQEGCAAAIQQLRARGAKNVIITRGEQGCAYHIGDQVMFCPAEKVQAVDTTSAGDSFIGALCVKLTQGADLTEAVKYASRVSAVTVSRKGSSVSIPYAQELDF